MYIFYIKFSSRAVFNETSSFSLSFASSSTFAIQSGGRRKFSDAFITDRSLPVMKAR